MHSARTLGLATAMAAMLAFASAPAVSSHAEAIPDIPVIDSAVRTSGGTRTDTMIVTFDRSQVDPAAAARAAVADAAQDIADADVKTVTPISPGMVAVTFDTTLSGSQQARLGNAVADESGVRAAEPTNTFHVTSTGDPTGEEYWPYLWNLGSNWGIRAPQAWTRSTGVGAVVGIIDTGITAHLDLTASPTLIVGGNVVRGYDFITNPSAAGDGDGRDADPTDSYDGNSFHGTHVAGIIGARLDGKGVVGTAPGVRIQPLRAIGEGGGSESDIMTAMRWGAGLAVPGMAANPTPNDVLNLSIGGVGICSTAMQQTVNAVIAKGVVIVVSAGNETEPVATSEPANCKGVVRVAATGATGLLSDYSNYGTEAVPLTIAAPGGSSIDVPAGGRPGYILSDWHDAEGPDYVFMQGTSMAAPHVSGVVALLKSLHKSLTPAEIVAILQKTASPLGRTCAASVCGAGIVDAAAAVAAQAPAPALLALKITKSPAVTGTRKVGHRLTGRTGTWTPGPSLARQWLRDGRPIARATGSTYRLTSADHGHRVRLQVTATRQGYTTKVWLASALKIR